MTICALTCKLLKVKDAFDIMREAVISSAGAALFISENNLRLAEHTKVMPYNHHHQRTGTLMVQLYNKVHRNGSGGSSSSSCGGRGVVVTVLYWDSISIYCSSLIA